MGALPSHAVVTIVFSDLDLLSLSKESSWDSPQQPGRAHRLRRREETIPSIATTYSHTVKPSVLLVSHSFR